MLEFSLKTLRNRGYAPYYLYRQKYMSGALENVGWTKPGLESLYNIVMMEELHSVISVGGGGVTKLVDAEKGRILRLPNPKYPHEYLSSFEKVLTQKAAILDFYAR
jgi:oxygen-independent coproporphyrinogen-3 oxidase